MKSLFYPCGFKQYFHLVSSKNLLTREDEIG